MHRDVDAFLQQCILDFLREKPLSFHLVQWPVDFGIAFCLDQDDISLHSVLSQACPHPLRLPARELAAACADRCHANRLTSDSTNPGTVCGVASITSRSPSSRAVSAVIGPMVAATNRPAVATSRPMRSTKLRTVDDDVNVTASMRPAKISPARPLRSVCAGTVRYTAIVSTSAPCFRKPAANASRVSSALGINTRGGAPPRLPPSLAASASASASPTNSSGTTDGFTPRRASASAVELPMAATAVVLKTRGVRPHATRRSNTICTAF